MKIVYPSGASILSRLEAGRHWQGLEVSSYVCALAALHLPAAGRSSANSTLAGFRCYIYTRNHDTRTFVDEVDFISAPGYKNKYGDRESWGFTKHGWNPNGPQEIISPIACMDFDEETKHMRIKSVHPGHTVDKVREKTGFDILVPSKVPETDPRTEEEIMFGKRFLSKARCTIWI